MQKTQTERTKPSYSKDDAAQILAAGVKVCQESGLEVRIIEKDGVLWIGIADLTLIKSGNGTMQIRCNGTVSEDEKDDVPSSNV